MTAHKPTPGPWKLELDFKDNGELRYFPTVLTHDKPTMRYSDGSGDEESAKRNARIVIHAGQPAEELQRGVIRNDMDTCLANARLIAAAPDLLAACEAALANMEAELNRAPRPMPDPQVAILLQDALKKARGGA